MGTFQWRRLVKPLKRHLKDATGWRKAMMNGDMMDGGMMFGMGLGWLLVIVLLVLGVAALVKYLRK